MVETTSTSFKLVGIALKEKTSNANGQSSIDCGALWQQFEQLDYAARIPDKEDGAVYAVYYDYEGDYTQPFSYFIGCKVSATADIPPGMDTLTVPEGSYQKIVARGQMPECVETAWRDIWSSEIARAYAFDFEVYDERSRDWADAEVDIYVSVGN